MARGTLNIRASQRSAKKIQKEIRRIGNQDSARILTAVGEQIVPMAQRTKSYQNRTGRGVRSYFFRVVAPGRNAVIRFNGPKGPEHEVYTAPRDIHMLLFGNYQFYLAILEALGYAVIRQVLPRVPKMIRSEARKSSR